MIKLTIMYLGIDIGGTKTLFAVLDESGVIVDKIKIPTNKDYNSFIHDLSQTVDKLSTKNFTAAAVAIAGRLDDEKNKVVAFGNLPWQNVPFREDLLKFINCPLFIENDSKLGALSEAMLLKGKYRKVLYITIGTGIGSGYIVDQKIVPILDNSEAGQMPMEHNGKILPWEKFASGSAIVRQFGKKASEITDEKTWHVIAHNIAIGVADLSTELMPDVVVMGGGVNENFDKYSDALSAELKNLSTPIAPIPPVIKASRPDDAVIYGCYDLAKANYGHD